MRKCCLYSYASITSFRSEGIISASRILQAPLNWTVDGGWWMEDGGSYRITVFLPLFM